MKDNRIFKEIHNDIVALSESSLHIKMDEYCEIANQQVALRIHSNSTFPRYHDHDFFEINYIYSGICENLIDDISHEMERGDLVIMHPNTYHILTASPNSCVVNILINSKWFNSTFNRECLSCGNMSHFIKKGCTDQFYKYVLFNRNMSSTKYYSIVDRILKISTMSNLPERYLLLESATIELICTLLKEETSFLSATRGLEKDIANSMKAYMHTNISNISLNKLSEKFGYSVSHICRIFKNNYNLTFKQLLIEAKIKKAKSYLSHTNKKICEIAQLLGYESVEYFDRMFKKGTSYTPSEYRAKFPDDRPNTSK